MDPNHPFPVSSENALPTWTLVQSGMGWCRQCKFTQIATSFPPTSPLAATGSAPAL